jgi:inhibitor of KinA
LPMSALAKLPPFTVYPISEKAVTIEFGNSISEDLLYVIAGFAELLKQHPFAGMTGMVPAYCTLTVFFNPLMVTKADMPGTTALEKVSAYLNQLKQQLIINTIRQSDIITIPVCYGEELGPDLTEVAQINNLTSDEVIRLHGSVTYLVHMIGFMPGFAYFGGMTPAIMAPRKAKPLANVPAGSVGIASLQTGIYPLQSPGGWQIIGQTPLKMFDAARAQPALLKAGDRVKFKAINLSEFKNIAKEQ